MELHWGTHVLLLLPQKALFLPEQRILVIADLHAGKITHFRKAGILMPADASGRDLDILAMLCDTFQPQIVLFLGDLFHSDFNSEWFTLERFMHQYGHIRFILTRGNHDILPDFIFGDSAIEVVDVFRTAENILFTHHPMETVPAGHVNIAGHVHPGCVLRGGARQQFRLPCFCLHDAVLLLPAFGSFTGLHVIQPAPGIRLFPVLQDEVIALKNA